MRGLLFFLCLTTLASVAQAQVQVQVQERSLEERLLRPNLSLGNSAQDKKFVAAEGAAIDKKFDAQTFSSGAAPTRSFLGSRNFLARGFSAKSYARTRAAEEAKRNAELAFAATEFPTKQSALIRKSVYADNSVKGEAYAENRPFLGQGTRQEILDQQNHVKPMTIEQVRELLNTNR